VSERHEFISGLNRELAAFVNCQQRPTRLKAREWQLQVEWSTASGARW
jgi:hypothetical protein